MAKRRAEDEQNRDVLLAFRTEVFRRQKNIDVRKYLVGDLGHGTRRGQRPEDMRRMLHTLSQHYGIPMRRRQESA